MKTSLRLALLLSFLTPSAFGQIARPIPYPLPESSAWQRAVKNGTRTNDGVPGAKYWTNHTSYDISAELDPETAKVTGHVDMVYENRSPVNIRSISVHLRQNLHKAGNIRNRYVEITGGVETSNVLVNGEEPGRGRVRTRGTVMTIRLVEELKPREKVTISLDWEYQVPKAGAPRNGHENFHVYYLGYWYPQIAVFDDVNGWTAEQYMSNAEFYMGYADYKLAFTVPAGWLVRATGKLENGKDVLTKVQLKRLAKARSSDEIVHVLTEKELEAGKATRKHKKKLTWRFFAENVRDLAVSVSDRYIWDATHAVVKDRDGAGKDGVCMIHAVYEPTAKSFERAAEFARHTIEYMSKKVYPYPWPHMTACQGVIGGGMEYPMMTICGGRGRSVQRVVTHELIHMWFPMLVGSNEKARAWQDEGVTSFFTGVTVADFRKRNQRQPDNTSSRRPRARRRGRTGRTGRNRRRISRPAPVPIMRHGDHYPERGTYSAMSYGKTSRVLGQLRGLLGAQTFYAAFRKYAASWAYKHPYPADLFRTFSNVSGQDLDWYFRTWFYETWTLDQAIQSVASNDKGTELIVSDNGLATWPTEIEITYAGGKKETRRIDVKHWLAGNKTKSIQLGADVESVVLDPRNVTLDSLRRNNSWKVK